MSGLLLAGLALGCGALYAPPEPVLGPPLSAGAATVEDLDHGLRVLLPVQSGLRRERVVGGAAFELSGASGVLAYITWTPLEHIVPGGGAATVEWVTPLEGSLGEGGLGAEAPLVLSGTLWLEGPGRHTELVPFTVPATPTAESPEESP